MNLNFSRAWVCRLLVILLLAAVVWQPLSGCPFCSALSNTLREDFRAADYVCLATCEQVAEAGTLVPIHRFLVTSVLKGDAQWVGKPIEVYSLNPFETGSTVMLMGIQDGKRHEWGASVMLSAASQDYVRRVAEFDPLPASSGEKADSQDPREQEVLRFYLKHLTSPEEFISKDAYNEFAQASMADLRLMKPYLDRVELMTRIRDEQTGVERRRLYWTLLSICGEPGDIAVAEEFIRKTQLTEGTTREPVGLEAAISCYLVLGGERALLRIEEDLLRNEQAHYSDSYSAIVAIRVHSDEFKMFSNERLSKSFHYVLERPSLADLVVPDLARWEDWTQVAKLLELFEKAGSAQQFVRMPIVNYLRACPLPEARQAVERCREIDPDVVRRAIAFFPLAADAGT